MAWQDIFTGNQPGLSDEDRTSLARGGLLQAGLSALSANSQPGVTPIQALSGGLLGGIQSAQQSGQQLVKQRFQQAQMDDQQQQMQRRQRIQDISLRHVITNPDGTKSFDQQGYMQELMGEDPEAYMDLHKNELQTQAQQLAIQKAQRPEVQEVNSGDNILTQEVGLDGTRKTIATAPRWNPKQMGIGGGAGGGHFGPGAFQLIQGKDGQYYNVNKVTGEVTPVQAGGAGVIGNNTFRDTSQQLKNADAVQATDAGIDNVTNAIKAADTLKMSKGIGVGTGLIGSVAREIPGTDAYAFGRDLDSFKGNLFLQAFNQLRGGGAITDVEGQKATDAISSIDPKMSREDVVKRIDIAQGVLLQGLERAKKKSMSVQRATGAPTQAAPGGQPKVFKFNPATGQLEAQ